MRLPRGRGACTPRTQSSAERRRRRTRPHVGDRGCDRAPRRVLRSTRGRERAREGGASYDGYLMARRARRPPNARPHLMQPPRSLLGAAPTASHGCFRPCRRPGDVRYAPRPEKPTTCDMRAACRACARERAFRRAPHAAHHAYIHPRQLTIRSICVSSRRHAVRSSGVAFQRPAPVRVRAQQLHAVARAQQRVLHGDRVAVAAAAAPV